MFLIVRSAVTLLTGSGAEVNVQDNQGCLPLHLAAWTGNADICKALLMQAHPNYVNTQVCYR